MRKANKANTSDDLGRRGWDLLRQMRSHLLNEDLISEDEYSALLIAPRSEGAVQRLEEYDEMRVALEESVRLQCHYAKLLNMHDGGERMLFRNADEWLARLRKLRLAEREEAD